MFKSLSTSLIARGILAVIIGIIALASIGHGCRADASSSRKEERPRCCARTTSTSPPPGPTWRARTLASGIQHDLANRTLAGSISL